MLTVSSEEEAQPPSSKNNRKIRQTHFFPPPAQQQQLQQPVQNQQQIPPQHTAPGKRDLKFSFKDAFEVVPESDVQKLGGRRGDPGTGGALGGQLLHYHHDVSAQS